MIEVSGLRVSVPGRDLLAGIDLSLAAARVTGLLGPNGSGKTTLLSTLAGVRRPSAGNVRIDGDDVRQMSARRRARLLALVEQHATTGLELTAHDVVALGRIPHRSRFGAGDPGGPAAIARALETVMATDLADKPWHRLSGGERQRVQLARALAQEPSVLLLDEPTNHLDLAHQLRFLDRVRALGLTTVVALHDLDLAAAYCDEVVVLEQGRVVRHGSVEQTLERELVADVYRVDVAVEPHPARPQPHIRWNAPLEDT